MPQSRQPGNGYQIGQWGNNEVTVKFEREMDLVVPACMPRKCTIKLDISKARFGGEMKCSKKYPREFSLISFHFMVVLFFLHDKARVSGFFFFFEQIKHDANLRWHSLI